jgi:hypothetical protein
MTPYEELVAENPMGPSTYALLIDLLRASTRSYPPPAGHHSWTREAAADWLQDYFFPTKGERVALKFLTTATDDETLVLVARTAIRRALTDDARATTAGRMVARLETLLPREGFIDARKIYAGTKAWTLPELGDAIYQGDWKDLLRDPRLKGIQPIVSLPTQGTASKANIASIVQAVRGLLLAAGGAMYARDVANAVVTLFELDDPTLYALRDTDQDEHVDDFDGRSPDDEPLTEYDEPDDTPTGPFADVAQMYEDAERIWNSLTADEQRLIGVLDQPIAIWKTALPGRSDALAVGRALKAKLRGLLTEAPLAPGALDVLITRSTSLPR